MNVPQPDIKIVTYLRVSDPSQIDNISFKVQKESCEKYAKDHGMKIVKEFKEEGESAKAADRTMLKELLEYCRINKGRVKVCLVYKIDRFARNQIDHFAIKARLLSYGVSLRSATELIDDSIMGKAMEGMFAVMAELDNGVKSERVKEAMKSWVLSGRWVWGAKFGYINKKDSTDHATNPPDPIKAPYATELFKKFSTGIYSYKDLANELDKKGIKSKRGNKIHPQEIYKILTDKFYIGIIDLYGVETRGKYHKPLTDPKTFYKCQEVINKRSNNATKNRATESIDFPLRGCLLCPSCCRKLTATWCKGRKERYPKYYCVTKGCSLKTKTYRREDVHNNFFNFLQIVQPKKEHAELFRVMFMSRYQERIMELEGDSIRFRAALNELDAERKILIAMMKKGQLTDEEYEKDISEVRDKIAITTLQSNEVNTDKNEIEVCLQYTQNFIQTIALTWYDAPDDLKIKLQTMVFPKGISYDFKAISNRDLSLPFALNRQVATVEKGSVSLNSFFTNSVMDEFIINLREFIGVIQNKDSEHIDLTLSIQPKKNPA